MQPIFTADPNDPEDVAQLRRVVGAEALEHAFGPDGGGMREINENAATESLLQCLRKTGMHVTREQVDIGPRQP